MSLLTPEPGLLFWMLIAFGTVLVVLTRYGFPAITRMVEKRKDYIDHSLAAAREATLRMQHLKEEADAIVSQARTEQMRILDDARRTADSIVEEARNRALAESSRAEQEARQRIEAEKEDALRQIRQQVAVLSVGIAERVLRSTLGTGEEQMALIGRLFNELDESRKADQQLHSLTQE